MRRSTIALFYLVAATWMATQATGQTVVETFSGTRTYNVFLPGTPDGSGGIDFNVGGSFTTLFFDPGSMPFEGQPVDFSGTEAAWLATSHGGTLNVPVLSGPATVNTTGSVGWTGPALNTTADRSQQGVDLGTGFSASSFDLSLGLGYDARDHVLFWNSPVVPQLDGHVVDINTQETVVAVDPVNGVVQVSFTGQIVAFGNPSVPATSAWGVWILGLGLLGVGMFFLRRRG